MGTYLCLAGGDHPAGSRGLTLGLLAVLAVPGCSRPEAAAENPADPPAVRLVRPQVRTITRVVGQPSFVESYERTSIYPKVTGYIEKWNVDIGDRVKKGDVLATLFVPELREDWQTKKDRVELDKERVELALEVVKVAEADVQSAEASLTEAKAILGRYEAQVERWDSEVKRLKREVDRGVVDPQVLLESTNQWKASTAARDAARATIAKAGADLLAKKATASKAKVDVGVARADLTVAKSDARRMEAWVGYLTLTAPYDGVVVARNANTGDFVTPLVGDPTSDARSPYLSPSGKASPIYVVERTDVVRIFVDVPEQDANYVQVGTEAKVQVLSYRDDWIPSRVTRTSWALNVKSRTLRAEIDLPNPRSRILPGMYAYGKVTAERPDVRALPLSALFYSGNKTYCWRYDNGHAVRTEIQTGIDDGEWIEVVNRQHSPAPGGKSRWTPINGSEQVILGDLSVLDEDEAVQVAPETGKEIARETPGEVGRKTE